MFVKQVSSALEDCIYFTHKGCTKKLVCVCVCVCVDTASLIQDLTLLV